MILSRRKSFVNWKLRKCWLIVDQKEKNLHWRGNREEMDGHRNRIHAIRSHPSMESIFLTGGWDDTIHYWDQRTQNSQKHFSGPHICGDALDIVEHHQVILTGSWRRDSTLQVTTLFSLFSDEDLLLWIDLGFLHGSIDQRCLSNECQFHGQILVPLSLSLSLQSSMSVLI